MVMPYTPPGGDWGGWMLPTFGGTSPQQGGVGTVDVPGFLYPGMPNLPPLPMPLTVGPSGFTIAGPEFQVPIITTWMNALANMIGAQQAAWGQAAGAQQTAAGNIGAAQQTAAGQVGAAQQAAVGQQAAARFAAWAQVESQRLLSEAQRAIAEGNLELARRQLEAYVNLQREALRAQNVAQAYGLTTERLGLLAQLAQSPLVAWYTARGMEPPAAMQNLVQLLSTPMQPVELQMPPYQAGAPIPVQAQLGQPLPMPEPIPQPPIQLPPPLQLPTLQQPSLPGGGGGGWIGGGARPPAPSQPAITPDQAAYLQSKILAGVPLSPADQQLLAAAYRAVGLQPPPEGTGGAISVAILDQFRWGYGPGGQAQPTIQRPDAAAVRDKVAGFLAGQVPLSAFTPQDGLFIMEANQRLGRDPMAPVDALTLAELNQMAWGMPG